MGRAKQPGTPGGSKLTLKLGWRKGCRKGRLPQSCFATLDFLRLCLDLGEVFNWKVCFLSACWSLSARSYTQRQGEGRSPPTSCLLTEPHLSQESLSFGVWRGGAGLCRGGRRFEVAISYNENILL